MEIRKCFLLVSLFVMLFVSTVLTNLPLSKAQGTMLAVDPPFVDGITRGLTPGSTFSIRVNVSNVEAMLAYQFFLGYNTSVLTVTGYESFFPFIVEIGAEINDPLGYMFVANSMPIPEPVGFYTVDPFPVARIDFSVDGYGYSPLHLYNTEIAPVTGRAIPHTVSDGSFVNKEIHDIAVTGVTRNQTYVKPGGSISINATVQNQGTFTDSFDVTAYADTTLIGTQTVTNLAPETTKTLTFNWNTTGVAEATYTISANASVVSGETDTADNTYTDGVVTVTSQPVHDIAVKSVTVSPSSVFVGQNVTIQTTLQNLGNLDDSFNATIYYDENLIEMKSDITLLGGTSTTLTSIWNTTGVAFGTYTIKANATVVPGDINETNNVFIGGNVVVQLNDINVWNLIFTPSSVIVGRNVTMDASVSNDGLQNATFTVTAYYKNATQWTEIGAQNVTDLAPGQDAFPSFIWETTGVALGTYMISANASVLYGEINVADNSRVADGVVSIIPEVHDIAVTSVTASPTEIVVGGVVSINVTVENQGNMPETFDLSARRGTIVINTQTAITLSAGASKTLPFTWNTTGVTLGAYAMSANASVVSGETDTTDNTRTDGTVTVGTHDILILTATATPTQVAVGQSVTISVTVKNDGTFTQTNIDVTVYRDSTIIGTQTVASLPKAGSKTMSFTWNTTGVNPGVYTIKASASVVPGETNTVNNVKIAGSVSVKLGSTLSISVSSITFTVGESTTINGSITSNPGVGKTVTLSYRLSGEQTWTNTTTTTDANGHYSFEWKPTAAGTYEVKTSWAGDSTRLGDESDVQTITVNEAPVGFPLYWAVGIIIIVVIAVVLVYIFRVRKS